MTTTDTQSLPKRKVPWSPEATSIALAILNAALPAAWMFATWLRIYFGNEVANPQWWLTAAITITIPVIIFVWQMRVLTVSALRSTYKEAEGSADQKVSQASVMAIVVTCVLAFAFWLMGHLPLGPNHALGLAFYLVLGYLEMINTTDIWTVANRRPGGTIGTISAP